jgi:hypothetical protein
MVGAGRVVFVLHDVFRYTFDEVGEIVGRRSPVASSPARVLGAWPCPRGPT